MEAAGTVALAICNCMDWAYRKPGIKHYTHGTSPRKCLLPNQTKVVILAPR